MKCEKSFKRDMLRVWGIKQIGEGKSLAEVCKIINKMMRKTVSEVKEFVKEKVDINNPFIPQDVLDAVAAQGIQSMYKAWGKSANMPPELNDFVNRNRIDAEKWFRDLWEILRKEKDVKVLDKWLAVITEGHWTGVWKSLIRFYVKTLKNPNLERYRNEP